MGTLFGNLLTFLFGILLPVWLCFKVRKSYWVLLILFLMLSYTVMSGTFFLFEGPFLLVLGWVPFLMEKFPQITPSWEGLAMALTSLILLVYGGHWFLRWLYSHWGQAQASDSQRLWPMRWTLSLVALLVLFFSASIGFIGATHQTAWMLAADQPLIESRGGYAERMYNSVSKSDLQNVYLACEAFWQEKGSKQNCTVEIARQDQYGYQQSPQVVIRGGGRLADFHAVAGHLKGNGWFWVNPKGDISKLEMPQLNTRQKS